MPSPPLAHARTDGSFIGVEAVIDKDRASALLANQLGSDMLMLLTDVDAVYLDYGTPRARSIISAGAKELNANQFAVGSMRPKIEAATRFVAVSGHMAAIGRLEDAIAIVRGDAGAKIDAGTAALKRRR